MYAGLVITAMFSRGGIAAQQAMCGLVRYRDAETTVPATCRAASSEFYSATTAKLARRNDD
jgi:hypothetical protein